MVFFAWTVLLVFFILSLTALILSISIIFVLILARGVPFVSLPKADWVMMGELAELKPGQVVYDLGCGKANLLVTAAKKFGVKGVGYEISLWPYVWAKWNIWINRVNVDLRFKNFLKADIKNADVVFCYLFPHVMVELEDKFKTELKPGAKVISYAFLLPNIVPAKVVSATPCFSKLTKKPIHTSKIYLYEF